MFDTLGGSFTGKIKNLRKKNNLLGEFGLLFLIQFLIIFYDFLSAAIKNVCSTELQNLCPQGSPPGHDSKKPWQKTTASGIKTSPSTLASKMSQDASKNTIYINKGHFLFVYLLLFYGHIDKQIEQKFDTDNSYTLASNIRGSKLTPWPLVYRFGPPQNPKDHVSSKGCKI